MPPIDLTDIQEDQDTTTLIGFSSSKAISKSLNKCYKTRCYEE